MTVPDPGCPDIRATGTERVSDIFDAGCPKQWRQRPIWSRTIGTVWGRCLSGCSVPFGLGAGRDKKKSGSEPHAVRLES